MIFETVFTMYYFALILRFLISKPPLPSSSSRLLLHRQIIHWINWSVIKQFDGNICTQCVSGPSGNLAIFAFPNQLGQKRGKTCHVSMQIHSLLPNPFFWIPKVLCPCRNYIWCDTWSSTFEDRKLTTPWSDLNFDDRMSSGHSLVMASAGHQNRLNQS